MRASTKMNMHQDFYRGNYSNDINANDLLSDTDVKFRKCRKCEILNISKPVSTGIRILLRLL